MAYSYLTHTTPEQRAHTVHFIKWHRAFIRSEAGHARVPGNPWRDTMTRPQAQEALSKMVLNAINGKAGISWPKKAEYEYQIACRRDQQALRDRLTRRVRIYQLNTRAARQRFTHLLSSYED